MESHGHKEFHHLTWTEIEEVISVLASQFTIKDKPSFITGIPRGGLVPAVLLSHKLGVDYVDLSTAVEFHSDIRMDTLIVDDISDSGESLDRLKFYRFRTATLYTRYNTSYTPQHTGAIINHDKWLVFPWELSLSKKYQSQLDF